MAVTVNSIPIRVRSYLRSRGQDASNLRSNQILPLVNDALAIMAQRIAKSDNYEGLQKDFSVTPTAGVIDLTALTNVIFDLARSKVRVASSNLTIPAVDFVETLTSDALQDAVRYSQDGTDLRFTDSSGALGAYATAVKLRANYIPTLSELSALSRMDYEATFIETLAGLLSDQIHEVRARELAATGRA